MKITIERDGQRFGPYTEADAREYLRTGRLKSYDLAYGGKATGWVTLSKLLDSPASSNFAAPPPPSSSQISSEIPKIVTVIGSVLLCLGAFTPVGSIPVLGGINFISLGWPSYVVLALAVVSIGFALANIPKLLWVSGTATSVVLMLVLVSFLLKQSDARAAMRDNWFGPLRMGAQRKCRQCSSCYFDFGMYCTACLNAAVIPRRSKVP